mgnify:CR=1 FL=1|jgi:hypothetical protein
MVAVRSLVDAEVNGATRWSEFVKNVTQTTTAGVWYDLTGASGNPRAKQWFDAAPLTAAAITQSGDGGIFHGSAVSTATKYLRFFRAACASATPLPMMLVLCDYLLYYPTIEDGNTDPQTMTNSVTLPRYTDGKGVQMMAVTISSRTGGQSFQVTYTNSDGVAGRVSPVVVQNAVAAPGTITTSATATANSTPSAFIPLQDGDSGVRLVESVQMLGADTGFFAIVLVKPIATTIIRGIDAPYDKDPLIFASELERIYDDAYLSLLALPNGSLSGLAVRGAVRSVWVN